MGLIVNKPAPELSFADLLAQLKIPATRRPRATRGCISAGRSSTAAASCCTRRSTRSTESSLRVSPEFAMTATVDILQDMARGEGPSAGAAGARLCRLGAGAARGRDPGERLADRAGGAGAGVRHPRRRQVGGGAALDLDRPAAAVGRGRPRLAAGGGGAGEAVVDREAEAGARDRRHGDAGRAGGGGEGVGVAQVGEEVGGGLGEVAGGREVEAGARRRRAEAEPDLAGLRRGGVEPERRRAGRSARRAGRGR